MAIAVQTGKISIQNFEETIQKIYQEADYVVKVQKMAFVKSPVDESKMVPDESKSGFGTGIVFRRNGLKLILRQPGIQRHDGGGIATKYPGGKCIHLIKRKFPVVL